MKEIVEQLENYATCSKTFIASAFTINYCFVDMNEENKILLQLKTLYETNLVKILKFRYMLIYKLIIY